MTGRKFALAVVALVAATAGLGGILIDALQVAEAVGGAPEADSLIPMPRRGDRVEYEATTTAAYNVSAGADGGVATTVPLWSCAYDPPRSFTLAFEWMGPGMVEDGFGRQLDVERVGGAYRASWHDLPADLGLPLNFSFHRAGLAPVVTEYAVSRDGGTGSCTHALDSAWQAGVGSSYAVFQSTSPLSCLLRGGWQGRAPDALAGEAYANACPRANEHSVIDHITPVVGRPRGAIAGDAPVEGLGWVETQRGPAFGLRTSHVGSSSVGPERRTYEATHEWWLAPGIAYPVRFVERIHFTSALQAEQEGTAAVWDGFFVADISLSRFAPGDEPIAFDGEPLAQPERRSGVAFGLLGPTGPSDGDEAALPLPLSEAVAHALNDPTLPAFHTWMRAHPDAWLTWADYSSEAASCTWGVVQGPRWDLMWSAPDGEAHIVHVGVATSVGGSILPASAPLPRPATCAADRGDWRGVAWARATAPREAPTLAAAAQLLHAAFSESTRVPHLGLSFHLGGRPLDSGFLRAEASHTSVDGGQSLGSTATYAVEIDLRTGALLSTTNRTTDVTALPVLAISPAASAPPAAAPLPRGALATSATVAAGAALLGVLSLLLQVPIARFLLAPLYTRLARSSALESPTRSAILDVVSASPGIHTRGVLAEVPCGKGAVSYHLEVLRRTGHLTRVDAGKQARWFVSGTATRDQLSRASALVSESARRLHALVCEEPGLTQKELARRVGVSEPAIHYTLRRLEQEGAVERRADGRRMRVYPRLQPPLVRLRTAEDEDPTARVPSP